MLKYQIFFICRPYIRIITLDNCDLENDELPRDRAPKYQMEFSISDPEGRVIKSLYE